MAIYLLSADADGQGTSQLEHRLEAAIPNLIRIGQIDDIFAAPKPSEGPNYLLLIAPSREAAYPERLAAIAERYRDRIFFVLIADDISASEYKALIRSGGAEWISARAGVQEIVDLVSRRPSRERTEKAPVARADSKRIAVSFVPSAGGVGNSTLAVEIAVSLKTGKRTRDTNICIVDLDFQSSHVCDYLDLEPRLKMQEIASDPERLDAQLFEIFISRHASGLHVFAAPRSKTDACHINVLALDRLFDMISARYQLILIDLPLTWFSWTPQIVAASDGVVVTGVNSIPGLRQIAETLAAVRENAGAGGQIAIAVNRCQRRFWGGIARRRHVESVLGRENVFYVTEENAALESINAGTPIMLAKGTSSIAREISALAVFCTSLKNRRAIPAR
jgi:pilus assembly protein CpaE